MSLPVYLIIGGTGTLGKELIKTIYHAHGGQCKIRVLSRGEHPQMLMQEALLPVHKLSVHFLIGDVRDAARMKDATRGVDHVFHLAAMKSVDKAEYDPYEAVQTNIIGTKNVIDACRYNSVKTAMFTSTDKAVEPLNIYGASKLTAEKLWIQANIGTYPTKFAVCRYGNVFGSNGSVLKKWTIAMNRGEPINITHDEMTRFFISPKGASEFVFQCSKRLTGGEVFIPNMKSVNLAVLAEEFRAYNDSTSPIKTVGLRPGEKLHEILISVDEVALTTSPSDDYFVRWPETSLFKTEKYGDPIELTLTSYNAIRFTNDDLYDLFVDYENSIHRAWNLS